MSYGIKCAQSAIKALHGKKINGHQISISHAVSGNKCELFVKGFPSDWNEEHFKKVLEPCGFPNALKVFQTESSSYAVICF